jgi:hypothetical protein
MSTPYCFAGWQKASIYNPLNGSVIQFNTLNPAMTNYERPGIKQEHTTGSYQSGKSHKLSFGGFGLNQESIDLLQTWARDKTLVRAVCAGTGKAMQWYESVEISEILTDFKGKRNAGDNSYGVVLTCDKHNAQIFHNENLLAYLGWADVNPVNQVPDGYTTSGSGACAFSSSALTMTSTSGPADYIVEALIVFPIEGVRLTASLNFTKRHSDAGNELRIRSATFADVSLNASINSFVTTGVGSGALFTLSGVYTNEFLIQINDPTSIDTMTTKFPSLTTNGKVTPGTKLMNW